MGWWDFSWGIPPVRFPVKVFEVFVGSMPEMAGGFVPTEIPVFPKFLSEIREMKNIRRRIMEKPMFFHAITDRNHESFVRI